MLKFLKRYYYFLLGCISLIAFLLYFSLLNSNEVQESALQIEEHFQIKEQKLNSFLATLDQKPVTHSFNDWNNRYLDAEFYVHVYRNDSLIYWNNNEMPVHQFSDIHFPTEGLVKLQNGWYFSRISKKNGVSIVGSFLVRTEYPYENEYLKNGFAPCIKSAQKGTIHLEKIAGQEIHNREGNYLFSFQIEKNYPFGESESKILTSLLLLTLIFLFQALQNRLKNVPFRYSWLIIPLVVGLRLLSLHFDLFSFMGRASTFQPELYAQSDNFPTFGDYLINCVVSVFIFQFLSRWISHFRRLKWAIPVGISSVIFGFFIWHYIIALMAGLIDNSSIPLLINQLFSLNYYSFLTLISIGFLYYGFYRLTRSAIRLLGSRNLSKRNLIILFVCINLVYVIYEYFFGLKLLFIALIPGCYYALALYHHFLRPTRFSTPLAISYLVLVSITTAIQLTTLSHKKERATRELFANQLASDKDELIELEFDKLSRKISTDVFLSKFTIPERHMNLSDFEDAMERRFFSGIWDKYELSFNLFDTLGIPLVADESQNFTYAEINELIEEHTTKSDINPSIYFVKDYSNQLNYIIRLPLKTGDQTMNAVFYCTLKSKKIPEEIGFPRLLISSNTTVLKTLENYSIARYTNGRLIAKYGIFNYPTKDEIIRQWKTNKHFTNAEGYDHFVLIKPNGNIIVLSQKLESWFDLFTSFSFVFCFFGILLFPVIFWLNRQSRKPNNSNGITLAVKIQLVLLGLVFVSLAAFSYGSSLFVNNQYQNHTEQLTREKLNSVSTDLQSKIGTKNTIDINKDGNYMEYLLRRFSKIFVTDINLYDTKGYMLASSRPKIYNVGLQSEQINPEAFQAFVGRHKSEFIHLEKIGTLQFISAYIPFYNNEGKLLGLINLQHFGQQEEYENQIESFLIAIINVFMLLLMLSTIFSIFVSSWVIAPLNLLQESFSKVKFGKSNQRIDYDREDEIGTLVRDYNNKLEELEFAAQQIAKSERETAWREMAKQVAHEIKNPLTPMKLSIQQLQRVFDPNDPDSKEKIDRVSKSLIEQIDSLTNIANEFSSFAKMPQPNEVEIDLVELLLSVIEVFQYEKDLEINLSTQEKSVIVMGDKDQLLRVFNNLLKNAIQAIPEDSPGVIEVRLKKEGNTVQIEIQDNGCGISEEEKVRIFEPYFTTKNTGTGLGLAMVRQIIENHRGQIYFESIKGKGTTFTINLPSL